MEKQFQLYPFCWLQLLSLWPFQEMQATTKTLFLLLWSERPIRWLRLWTGRKI
ncbi:hypothetical protein Avbf_08660 [Armadillidium vulgare]|nr:hypothetical protein Avbf_08660 [Armadillidium vulgare]